MARPILGIKFPSTYIDSTATTDHAFNPLKNLAASSTDLHPEQSRSLFDAPSHPSLIGASDWELDILSTASLSYAKLINDSKIASLSRLTVPSSFVSMSNAQSSSSSLHSSDSFNSLGLESTCDKLSPSRQDTRSDSSVSPIHSLDSRTLASRRASTFGASDPSFASNSIDRSTASTAHSLWEHDIISASSLGLVRMVTDLLSRGADPSACNEKGWTPVMHAAQMGHFSVLKILVNHGAAVDTQEPLHGKTALMLAASNGHTRCVEILISARADRTIVDHQGHNAAYYATANGHGNNHLMSKYLHLSRSRPRTFKPPVQSAAARRNHRR